MCGGVLCGCKNPPMALGPACSATHCSTRTAPMSTSRTLEVAVGKLPDACRAAHSFARLSSTLSRARADVHGTSLPTEKVMMRSSWPAAPRTAPLAALPPLPSPPPSQARPHSRLQQACNVCTVCVCTSTERVQVWVHVRAQKHTAESHHDVLGSCTLRCYTGQALLTYTKKNIRGVGETHCHTAYTGKDSDGPAHLASLSRPKLHQKRFGNKTGYGEHTSGQDGFWTKQGIGRGACAHWAIGQSSKPLDTTVPIPMKTTCFCWKV